MSDESDLTDTGQWTRDIHGDRRDGAERRMDPHSLNRRLTEVEHTQIAMSGDVSRIQKDLANVSLNLTVIASTQVKQDKQLARWQNISAGALSVMALIVTAWNLFGGWIARQIAESMM